MATSSDHPGFLTGTALTPLWSDHMQELVGSLTPRIDVTPAWSSLLANTSLVPELSQLLPDLLSWSALAPFQDQLAGIISSTSKQLLPSMTTTLAAATAVRALGFTSSNMVPVSSWASLPAVDTEWITNLTAGFPALDLLAGGAAANLLASSQFQKLTDTFAATMKLAAPDMSAVTGIASSLAASLPIASTVQVEGLSFSAVLRWATAFPLPTDSSVIGEPPTDPVVRGEQDDSPDELTTHLSAVSMYLLGTAAWLKATLLTVGRSKASADKVVDGFNENMARYLTLITNLAVLATAISLLANQVSERF